MSLLHYIDNEVPAYAEWDDWVETGSSTIQQSASATFPGRGSYGLRHTTVASSAAYVQKDTTYTIPPGDSVFVGTWLKTEALAASFTLHLSIAGVSEVAILYQNADGTMMVGVRDDAGARVWPAFPDKEHGQWVYVVIEIQRATSDVASDGACRCYLNGLQVDEDTGIDNYDICGSAISVIQGSEAYTAAGAISDYDELKIATTYPEPYVPTPTSDYLCPERICIIYGYNSYTSRASANTARDHFGIPCANVIPVYLPVSLTSYADYTTYITDAIDEVFANHPTVAANCMCFLLADEVHHTFIESGTIYSTASWLMNYGGTSTPQLANPFYQTKARLTKAGLNGKYMAVVGRGAETALDEPLDSDTLYSDETTYLTSLPAQRLRIVTSALGTYSNDAFVFGDTGDVSNLSFGSAGSRIAWVDTSDDSALHLEYYPSDEDATLYAAFTEGYIAGMGSTDTADGFDPEAFFEVLRIGTFAEAALVSCEYLKSTACPVGSPLLTVPFQQKGYSVYRGLGGPEAIDWSTPVANIRAGCQSHTTQLALAPENKHVFGIRTISSAGIAEQNSHIINTIELDDQGNLLGSPLSKVSELTASVLANNSVRLGMSYQPMPGTDSPASLEVYTDSGSGSLNLESPISVVPYIAGRYDFEVLLAEPVLPALFAVRAIRGSQAGPLSKSIRVALSPAPQGAIIFQE